MIKKKIMLRIKDNVDLKELEKFGFVFEDNGYYLDFIPYNDTKYSYLAIDEALNIDFGYINHEYDDHFNKALVVLFDLIKADLVDKVEDKE